MIHKLSKKNPSLFMFMTLASDQFKCFYIHIVQCITFSITYLAGTKECPMEI